jgi:hypothetical protein
VFYSVSDGDYVLVFCTVSVGDYVLVFYSVSVGDYVLVFYSVSVGRAYERGFSPYIGSGHGDSKKGSVNLLRAPSP